MISLKHKSDRVILCLKPSSGFSFELEETPGSVCSGHVVSGLLCFCPLTDWLQPHQTPCWSLKSSCACGIFAPPVLTAWDAFPSRICRASRLPSSFQAFSARLCSFPGATITKDHKPDGSNHRSLLSHSSGAVGSVSSFQGR